MPIGTAPQSITVVHITAVTTNFMNDNRSRITDHGSRPNG
jgi:hypothetical protein